MFLYIDFKGPIGPANTGNGPVVLDFVTLHGVDSVLTVLLLLLYLHRAL